MRIPSNRFGISAEKSTKSASEVKQQSKVAFSQLAEQVSQLSKPANIASLTWSSELSQLANDVVTGKTSKEQASRQFVHVVLAKKMDLQQPGMKRVEDAVADMVESDPIFVAKLHQQLLRLGKQ